MLDNWALVQLKRECVGVSCTICNLPKYVQYSNFDGARDGTSYLSKSNRVVDDWSSLGSGGSLFSEGGRGLFRFCRLAQTPVAWRGNRILGGYSRQEAGAEIPEADQEADCRPRFGYVHLTVALFAVHRRGLGTPASPTRGGDQAIRHQPAGSLSRERRVATTVDEPQTRA
ncbi:hypothetical protein DSECCO2_659590 [anaerobic digester metagenome]